MFLLFVYTLLSFSEKMFCQQSVCFVNKTSGGGGGGLAGGNNCDVRLPLLSSRSCHS